MPAKDDQLPHEGQYFRSPNKRYAETVIFVHHYGGNRSSVRKHQEFLSELGFDSVAFTLSQPPRPKFFDGFLLNELKPGLRERWTEEILDVLLQVPGPQIIYSFSFPSAAAALAMAKFEFQNTRAWIADGGPFLMPLTCFWNYFTHIEKTPALWRRAARVGLGAVSLGMLNLENDLAAALTRFPQDFPVLSIRSWQDPLVPITAIDEAFSNQEHLHLESLTLAEAGHIDGLQRFPEDYKPRVAKFLNQFATRINTQAKEPALQLDLPKSE